jgi:hypothetical protein
MKRNILLAFLLVGLVVMEWGCKEEEDFDCCGCIDPVYKFLGIDELKITDSHDSAIKITAYDSVSWSDVVFQIKPATMRIVMNFSASSFLFATQPCYGSLLQGIDSVRVFSEGENVSLYFDYVNKNYSWNESLYGYWYADIRDFEDEFLFSFAFNKSLGQTDTFQFTFQFFDTEGNIFETTTEPIVITP